MTEQALDELRAKLSSRPETPEGFICEAVAVAVQDALANESMQERLRESGWVLVRIGDGTCPEAPVQWLHDGLDMTQEGWVDPVGSLEQMWRQAWTAGWQVGNKISEETPDD